jgi:hypothetical protein
VQRADPGALTLKRTASSRASPASAEREIAAVKSLRSEARLAAARSEASRVPLLPEASRTPLRPEAPWTALWPEAPGAALLTLEGALACTVEHLLTLLRSRALPLLPQLAAALGWQALEAAKVIAHRLLLLRRQGTELLPALQ